MSSKSGEVQKHALPMHWLKIDFTDGIGTGSAGSFVSLTNELTNGHIGKTINPEEGFSGAIIESGNAGCSTSIFSWTNYPF